MRIPLRPSRLEIRRTKVKFIIIHHTAELYPAPEAQIDNDNYQMKGLFSNVLEKKAADINYHYILDKNKGDFVPIVCRPFVTLCEFPDIATNVNNSSIHLAALGSYSFKIPEKRMYEILAFRLICPMLKMFQLSPSRVYFHNEVSEEEIDCPGDFMDKAVLITMIRKYFIK